jgi:nitrite reductase (NADH) small subunit
VPAREGRAVRLDDREVAIFNLGERFVATDNRCPHRGGPLSDGIVTGASVVCPLHAWKVNVDTGAVERPAAAACVTTYPVRVEDGIILVGLPCHSEMLDPEPISTETSAPPPLSLSTTVCIVDRERHT